jgi:hypothetical protein
LFRSRQRYCQGELGDSMGDKIGFVSWAESAGCRQCVTRGYDVGGGGLAPVGHGGGSFATRSDCRSCAFSSRRNRRVRFCTSNNSLDQQPCIYQSNVMRSKHFSLLSESFQTLVILSCCHTFLIVHVEIMNNDIPPGLGRLNVTPPRLLTQPNSA